MVRALLKTCLNEIEEHVYNNEEDIVDEDGALVVSLSDQKGIVQYTEKRLEGG